MCDTCGKSKCCCSDNGNGVDPSEFLQLQASVAILMAQTKFLAGHPILALDEPTDIAAFDFTSGLGSGTWLGWSICNGLTYPSPTGPISTPDLKDRFLTGAYGTYTLGQVGGENTHVLTIPEIPVHNHALTDPGHIHAITDPGHTHVVNDPAHTHNAVPVAHQHSFTTNGVGDHSHSYEKFDVSGDAYSVPQVTVFHQIDFDVPVSATTGTAGAHSHTGTTDPTTETVNISSAVTGITNNTAVTSVTVNSHVTGISLANTGDGLEHENRPPFYAVLWVKKIF